MPTARILEMIDGMMGEVVIWLTLCKNSDGAKFIKADAGCYTASLI
jgi:hypothetical protein